MFVIDGEGLSRTLLYAMKCSAQPSTNSSLSVIRLFLFATFTTTRCLFTTTRFSSVHSCEDLLISSFHRSANMWIFIYLKSSRRGDVPDGVKP